MNAPALPLPPPAPPAAPATAGSYAYVGGELALFERARNWKAYWAEAVAPHLGGDVLEVGAGNGNNVRRLLALGRHRTWTCLEPDAGLLAELQSRLAAWGRADDVQATGGTVADLPPERRFDALLYADVLEHIADDRGEIAEAARRLRPGGRLVVLAPAHQALLSEFDVAVGHYRRYSARSLAALGPPAARLVQTRYLDAVGLAASLANKLVLRRPLPDPRQIVAWDRLMVPLSRRLDPLLGYRMGKSVLAVWEARG